MLTDVMGPHRLGVEVAVLGGRRCDLDALRRRIALAADRPGLLLLEYGVLPDVELPPDVHMALVDPPPDAEAAEWVEARAAGRWLHLLWGEDELAFARRMAEGRWQLRPVAAALWGVLADGVHRAWGADLDRELLGASGLMRPPAAVADAVVALSQIGVLQMDATGIRGLPATGTSLDEAPRARACRERLTEVLAFLDCAGSLTFAGSAISCTDARATG